MNVKELIERLESMDNQNAEIVIAADSAPFFDLNIMADCDVVLIYRNPLPDYI